MGLATKTGMPKGTSDFTSLSSTVNITNYNKFLDLWRTQHLMIGLACNVIVAE
jgi:hypothetical protein